MSIARALSSHPSLILADEPTGALDSKSGIEIMQMMHDLHEEGNTIIIITHDLNIAKQAERIVTIRDGKIVSDIDNRDDMADATNVKGSDLSDKANGKVADLEAVCIKREAAPNEFRENKSIDKNGYEKYPWQ